METVEDNSLAQEQSPALIRTETTILHELHNRLDSCAPRPDGKENIVEEHLDAAVPTWSDQKPSSSEHEGATKRARPAPLSERKKSVVFQALRSVAEAAVCLDVDGHSGAFATSGPITNNDDTESCQFRWSLALPLALPVASLLTSPLALPLAPLCRCCWPCRWWRCRCCCLHGRSCLRCCRLSFWRCFDSAPLRTPWRIEVD